MWKGRKENAGREKGRRGAAAGVRCRFGDIGRDEGIGREKMDVEDGRTEREEYMGGARGALLHGKTGRDRANMKHEEIGWTS